MELALFVYLAGILTQLKIALGMIVGAVVLYGIIYSINWDMDRVMGRPNVPYNKKWMGIGVAFLISLAAIPSERVAYTMAGAYAVQSVAEHPTTAEISSKVVDVINMKLNEYLKEGK